MSDDDVYAGNFCPECGGLGLRGCGSAWHDGRPDNQCSPACECRGKGYVVFPGGSLPCPNKPRDTAPAAATPHNHNQRENPMSDVPMSEADALERLFRHREFVVCRTFGHAWDSIPVTEPDPDGPQFWLRCERCTTLRKDTIDQRYGSLIRRKYDYPDDYKIESEYTPTRDDFRLKLLSIASDLSDRRAKKRRAS